MDSKCDGCGKLFDNGQLTNIKGNRICPECAKLLLARIQSAELARRRFWELEQQDEDFDDEEG